MIETETPGLSQALADDFRVAMRGLASGVSLVSARAGAERTGCVVSSLVSLNLQPPTLLLTLLQSNSTARLIGRTGRFGVSLASASQRAIVENFTHAPSGEPRFALGAWREAGPGGAWLLEGALSAFSCVVVETMQRGEHLILIGEVEQIVTNAGEAPLVHFARKFHTLA